ncbi:hypothetical protein Agub_g6198 [Astrephomene gubernaculifera]|uniref:Uncharacterized protein n=1 Tax=Astrephomene gubernaculifera TaxID=47775 RepID=A0AAD3HLL7_9CHLO|nr:hypothetical protein Agub_g6198 [Astrephomene gubernaculifera]
MAPKPLSKPSVLSAEAAAMEQKLAELRKAMEKERAKREALMANAGGGSIWRNGSSLRANVGKGSDAASRRPASGATAFGAAGGPGPAPSRAPASARGGSSSGTTEAVAANVPSVSGSRMSSARSAVEAARSATPDSQGGGSGSGGGGSGGGGMSCGTDDGPSLAAGQFSEADSHRSFLEALNEWRRGNRGDVPDAAAGQSSQEPAAGSSFPREPPRASARVSSSNLEVQTETRPVSRPTSAKPLSYFDKLVLNTTSRQAGHLAAGGTPESMRPSLTGQEQYGMRSASAMDVRPGSASSVRPGSAVGVRPASAAPGSTPVAPSAACASPAVAAPKATSENVPDSSAASDPLSILDRLEALERQRQELHAGDEDDDDPGVFTVTTATGVLLTKGVRLPDEVLLPCNTES